MKKLMWLIAVLWFLTENQFFGWNLTPQSANELLADGIAYILISLAVMSGRLGVTITVNRGEAVDLNKVNSGKSVTIK